LDDEKALLNILNVLVKEFEAREIIATKPQEYFLGITGFWGAELSAPDAKEQTNIYNPDELKKDVARIQDIRRLLQEPADEKMLTEDQARILKFPKKPWAKYDASNVAYLEKVCQNHLKSQHATKMEKANSAGFVFGYIDGWHTAEDIAQGNDYANLHQRLVLTKLLTKVTGGKTPEFQLLPKKQFAATDSAESMFAATSSKHAASSASQAQTTAQLTEHKSTIRKAGV
jgi:hypothetical protein